MTEAELDKMERVVAARLERGVGMDPFPMWLEHAAWLIAEVRTQRGENVKHVAYLRLIETKHKLGVWQAAERLADAVDRWWVTSSQEDWDASEAALTAYRDAKTKAGPG